MGQDLGIRIRRPHLGDIGRVEPLVHDAAALPGDDADVGLGRDITGQEFVRDQNDLVDAPFLRRPLHHLHGIGAGAADVGFGLHIGRGVHIGDHRQARMALFDQPHVSPGDRLGQRTAGLEVRDQHRLVGAEDFRGLGHEMHARLDDDLRLRARGLLGQTQAVADIVADPVEDLGRHIVVGQDDGVTLALEPVDLDDQLGLGRPLHRGDEIPDLVPDRRGRARRAL